MTIEPIGAGRTRMSIESHFPSTEAMEQVLAMGMEEGLTQAVGQIDAILAEDVVTDRRRPMTTMTEPTTHTPWTRPAPTLTYDVRGADSDTRRAAAPAHHRIADGRQRVRHAREPLPRSHGRDLRPAGRRAQHEGRPGQPVHAGAARRRPAPDHRRARQRPGRPLRQQRRRGERARPRGRAPGAGPDARRARAAARVDPARPRGCARGLPRGPRHVPGQRDSAPAWRGSSSP